MRAMFMWVEGLSCVVHPLRYVSSGRPLGCNSILQPRRRKEMQLKTPVLHPAPW